ncbi:MAG: hypothetical protein IPP83_15335 [Flavobacteriales bacterium]|nr:hypothetical protein [Flavobacteriales bacterium]
MKRRSNNRTAPIAVIVVSLCSCIGSTERTITSEPISGAPPIVYHAIEDNIQHDTLLIQTTFDLGDGSFVMVASNIDPSFEGIRLYRYRFTADSSVSMLAISPPAYDSWTMLPTFFGADSMRTDALWLLANFGERESWGQKLLWMDGAFTDHGFMDVALPERVREDDTLRLKRRNIAPLMRWSERNDTTFFRFACDSVYLYDDQNGGYDRVVPARTIHYTVHPGSGLVLWMDGVPHAVKQPA